MYDDCRGAMGSFSSSAIRQMLAENPGDLLWLAEMDDDDIIALVSFMCFMIAAGDSAPFKSIWDTLPATQ